MAEYRLIYTKLKTGQILGEVPVMDVSVDESLNTPGSLGASLFLEDTFVMEAPDGAGGVVEVVTPQFVSAGTLAPGGTGVYLERDGVVMWGGVLWSLRFNVADSVAELRAEGFMSYLRRIHNQTDLAYVLVDQGAIAKDVLERAMAKGGADIGLSAPVPALSVARTRNYPATERKSFGAIIEQLAAVEGGFVWRFEHSWNDDQDGIDSVFVLDSSELGRETAFVLELGVNVSLLDLSLDGSGMANYVEAWGQADPQGAGFFRSAYDAAAVVSFPALERIETYSDVKVADTLAAKASEVLTQGKEPLQWLEVEVFPDVVPKLGSYEVGDRVVCRGSYGGLSVSGLWRIMDMKLAVSSSGAERVSLGLVPQGVF